MKSNPTLEITANDVTLSNAEEPFLAFKILLLLTVPGYSLTELLCYELCLNAFFNPYFF